MILALAALAPSAANEIVYDDELGPLWYSWSWTGHYDLAATSEVHDGETAIYCGMAGTGAFSLFRVGGFWQSTAIRFWIRGDAPPLAIRFEDTSVGFTAEDLLLSDLADVQDGVWTEVTVSLDDLPAGRWDRVSWVDKSGSGTVVYLDDIELIDVLDVPVPYSSAEPVGTDQLMLRGSDGDVTVTVDGRSVAVDDVELEGGPTRTYVQLAEPLSAGEWVVTTADGPFTRTIAPVEVTVAAESTHDIDPSIYGANFPDDAPTPGLLERYGYSVVRWGGNARARYNPTTRTTNLGSDWYFVNELIVPNAEAWVDAVDPAVDTLITVPNLDWVADDSEFWAYSVETYGEQQEVAPDHDDAGNGVLLDGTPITWNDPADASVPWTPADAEDWLSSFGPTLPDLVSIGNETDIAHLTHRPVVPTPATYEHQVDRFLAYATAAKAAHSTIDVTGPAGCCWFYYWNSGDPADHAAYGDFLPWFLDQVAAADGASGERTLDLLDLHYYPEGLVIHRGVDLVDPATRAWRLRATRSLWDPTYTDESWVGTSDVTDQPEPHAVQLLPRLHGLVDAHYPGTDLALSEWSFGAGEDLSGGLATADALGIFGAYDLDMAMMWPGPAPATPAASAFELIRTGQLTLGRKSLPVTGYDPDLTGVYAAAHDDGRVTLLLVNKDPLVDQLVTLDGVPHGELQIEHFGGALSEKITFDPAARFEGSLVVPAYGALLAEIIPDPPVDTGGSEPTDGTTPEETADTGTDPPRPDTSRCGGCSSTGSLPSLGAWGLALWAARRRRRA